MQIGGWSDFISTHSARGGGDELLAALTTPNVIFQPTPPVGAETEVSRADAAGAFISTHSARGGGDGGLPVAHGPHIQFQPTPPVGAETWKSG